jgi:hypothetical protein
MRSIESIQKELDMSMSQLTALQKSFTAKAPDKEIRAWRARVKCLKSHTVILKELLAYLETSPREEFVVKQLEDTKDKTTNRIKAWKPPSGVKSTVAKKLRDAFMKEHGVPTLSKRLRNLEILFREPEIANSQI